MKKTITGLLGTSLAGLVILFATHGKALLDSLADLPRVIEAWSAPSVIGLWCVLAGLLIPAGAWLAVDRWLPPFRNERWRFTVMDLFAFLGACWVVFLLLPKTSGLLIGIGCGLFAPLLGRGLKAGAAYVLDNVGVDP